MNNFNKFLCNPDSMKFLENLGVITPFEALAVCKINMRELELKKELQNNPEHFKKKLMRVDVTSSSGISEIIAKKLDVDLHPAWFSFDVESCIQHVHNQLLSNRDISSEVLFLYMQALTNNKNPNEITIIHKMSTDNQKSSIINRHLIEEEKKNDNTLGASVAAKIPFIIHKHPNWQIYIKDTNGNIKEFNNPNFSFNANKISDIIFTISNDDNSKDIIQFSGNQVSANNGNFEKLNLIGNVLTALDLNAETFYLTVHQGTLLSATEALRNSQNKHVELLENTDNNQSQFRPR